MKRKQRIKKPKGAIIKKPKSQNFYYLFYYFGRRVEKSTGLPDTPANRKQAEKELAAIMEQIRRGTFRFAIAFPWASEEEKAFFSEKEDWDYTNMPDNVLVGDFVFNWMKTDLPLLTASSQVDYTRIIACWIIPYIGEKLFSEITRTEIKRFILTMRKRKGVRGKGTSRSRINNVLVVLRTIWNAAIDDYHWEPADPFREVKKHLPKTGRIKRDSFRYKNWMKLLDALDPYYRPHTELMILTGMIPSELAGLEKRDISKDTIHVFRAIARGIKTDRLRTEYRERDIYITKAVRRCLVELLSKADGPNVVTMKDGTPFNDQKFRKRVWLPAIKRAEIPYLVPYCTRHSFAYWSLLIGIPAVIMVELMGHADKKMIFTVYARPQQDLYKDRKKIIKYMGRDYLNHWKGQTNDEEY